MPVTIDCSLEESDLPYIVDVPTHVLSGAGAIDRMSAFMESETLTGSYYRSLHYMGHGKPNVYRYSFTDYETAFHFKLMFG